MSNTAVVYYSRGGHTRRLACAVADGGQGKLIAVSEDGNIAERDWSELLTADAIIMGTPTYMGCISWQIKKFMEASKPILYERLWQNKVFGGFTHGSGWCDGKHLAITELLTFAFQHGGVWVSLGLPPGVLNTKTSVDLNIAGSAAGVQARTPQDEDASAMSFGDLETARFYGKRVAEIARRLTLVRLNVE